MTRDEHIQACIKLLESEVHSKRGLSGFAIKHAYQTLCSLKSNATYRAIDYLLDEFLAEYRKIGPDPKKLASAWLGITDEKAQQHSKTVFYGAYKTLRPSALGHLEAAIPKITQLFDQFGTLGTSTKFK